ncbi:hypothetical protein [[Pseudomonas] boreopolis]|uniref:Uncharacterized protein n=1 Tax=Xanthomonas boreopolis TaxID=86183 RepID=A0A919F7F2_9XANT|nr:hypothetical protein GCM10009090_17710 [[Pseudomonas] boreopolis]
MNTNVVPFQPAVEAYGARSLTAADVRAQVNLMQDVMAEVMRDGTHYGKIPGTNSKSLYKAGAEKLMATFRLAAKPEVEDLSKDGEITYRVTVNLLSASGNFVGAGIGECSSAEDKYSWRAAVHPKEWEATPANRRRIKYYRDGKETQQVRTNPADVANTILKMAKKRAQVDAVITATAASDIFTQDIEDLPDEVVAEIVGRTPPRESVMRQQPKVVDSPERDALYASLQDIATGGIDAYAEAWGKLTKEQRAMIGQTAHEGLKLFAEKVSAEDAA